MFRVLPPLACPGCFAVTVGHGTVLSWNWSDHEFRTRRLSLGGGTKTAAKAIKLMIAKWPGVFLVTISGWTRVKLLCLARFVFIFPVQLT